MRNMRWFVFNILTVTISVLHFFYFGPAFAEERIIDHEGYKYSLKEELSTDESKIVAIETFSPRSSELLSRIPDLPPDNCDPKIVSKINKSLSRLKGDYITFCKNDLGRRQSLFLMSRGRLAAMIEYDTCPPNLEWDQEVGAFIAQAYLRLTNYSGSAATFLVVYTWNPEILLTRHVQAAFNSSTSKYYLEYYFRLKKYITNNTGEANYYPELVAALISSSSLETICREISVYPLSTISNHNIKEYIDLAVSFGFPTFDLTNCKGEK